MFVEWLLIVLLLSGVGYVFFGKWTAPTARLWIAVVAVSALVAVWWWQEHLTTKLDSQARLNVPHVGREKFAGSASCQACHPDQYASWHQSFHRTMTQIASPESVRGKFNNVMLELDGEVFRLERRGDEFWVEMVDPEWTIQQETAAAANKTGSPVALASNKSSPPRGQFRMTMLTGSHHMQAYWVDNQHGNQQYSFPFVYLFEQERWVPRRSVFIRDPHPRQWIQLWNVGCINCHATAGQPRAAPDAVTFDTRVAELGIACEACHGPAAEHVRLNSDPRRRYALHLQKQNDASIINPAKLSSKRSSDVCGRCHSIHASREDNDWLEHGESYRPGEVLEASMRILRTKGTSDLRRASYWNDGMVRVSGREYNGLIRTPCYEKGELSCLSCHSMHQSSPDDQLAQGMDSNAACLQCHQSFAKNLEQHTHHPANSSGSLCYNCHMPHTTYGLLKAMRSHQISNPSVKESVQFGRPNACNLCHLDKTLDWTAKSLASWYGTPPVELSLEQQNIAASILWALKGDAGQRALIAWNMGWKPAQEISKDSWLAPYLATLLADPYPAVRYIAGRSLKQLPGYDNFACDYLAPSDELPRQSARALEIWTKTTKPAANTALLLDSNGHLEKDAVETLLKSRNNRVIQLDE